MEERQEKELNGNFHNLARRVSHRRGIDNPLKCLRDQLVPNVDHALATKLLDEDGRKRYENTTYADFQFALTTLNPITAGDFLN